MKIIRGFIVFLYTLIFLASGILLISLSLETVTSKQVNMFLNEVYGTPLYLFYVGLAGLLLIILAFGYIYSLLKGVNRKKTISIKNPDGEVIISLSAIEDFVQRIASNVTEIKELRCKVISSRKGLKVINNVIILSDINIPELTEKFQEMVRLKLQEMLGIEGNIEVKMYVSEVEENGKDSSVYSGEIDYSK